MSADELADVIAAECDVPMVTRWYVVAEVIDDEGTSSLETLHSNGLSQWDACGMLRYAERKAGDL